MSSLLRNKSLMLMISEQIRIPLEEIRFTFVRSSGPGGQNVNKVASKAVLRWNPAISGLLTAEQLEDFKYKAPEAWAALDESTRNYLQTLIDTEEELQEVKNAMYEALTGMSFDDVLLFSQVGRVDNRQFFKLFCGQKSGNSGIPA